MSDGYFPILVSRDNNDNSQTNPIYIAVTDGSDLANIDSSGRLSVSVDNVPEVSITGTVTVSATDLDIRNLSALQDNVAISDGTDTLAINSDGSINALISNSSIVVTATDLDIRDLSHTQDSVKIGDGTDLLAINSDGSINVNIVSGGASGTKIHDHKTSTNVPSGGTDNHDYTASGGTFELHQISVASPGPSKAQLIYDPLSTNKIIWTGFIPGSGGEAHIVFTQPFEVADTKVIRIVLTNRGNKDADLYSLIEGVQK